MERNARIRIVRSATSVRHRLMVGHLATIWNHAHAASIGDSGPSKILCKYPDCTNPACPFRHEDANGNPIPPPALTRKLATSSDMETDEPTQQSDIEVTMETLDSHAPKNGSARPLPGKPLNGTIPVPCKFAGGCANPKCKFIHDNRKPCNFGVKCFKGV